MCVLTPPDLPQLHSCAERDIAMLESTSLAACIRAKHLFLDPTEVLPKQTDNLRAKSINWVTEAQNITETMANPGRASPNEM